MENVDLTNIEDSSEVSGEDYQELVPEEEANKDAHEAEPLRNRPGELAFRGLVLSGNGCLIVVQCAEAAAGNRGSLSSARGSFKAIW